MSIPLEQDSQIDDKVVEPNELDMECKQVEISQSLAFDPNETEFAATEPNIT